MEDGFQKYAVLLELSATDDLDKFTHEIQEKGLNLDEPSLWYGRRIGSKVVRYEKRTPLMISAMYGSTKVLKYLIDSSLVDVNAIHGSDNATALHCATSGGSDSSLEVVRLLLDAAADANSIDANGNRPRDVMAPALITSSTSRTKALEMLLNGTSVGEPFLFQSEEAKMPSQLKEGNERREYPVDVSLPDINIGIYGTDEFRMYSFKVKPCSRAYSHDWTECPFIHPGENARRRDPRKYPYSCVPCPEFRKGNCRHGDACEYAHGIFESWLHPAQYRTRLCKDETGCARKVCFFAHKAEELRPLYATTGSGIPSPRSPLSGAMDMSSISPLILGGSFTQPMPLSPVSSSSMSVSMWNKLNLAAPPSLQLPGSRLKTASNARDIDMDMELRGLDSSHLSSESWNCKPTKLDEIFGIFDNSPSRYMQNHLMASYPSRFGMSRSAAFANRSQSFVDREHVAINSAPLISSGISGWSSPGGKLDWGVKGDELSKLKKSSSFAYGGGRVEEPDVSWVNSLVKDVPGGDGHFGQEGVLDMIPPWVQQLYMEQEQMVA